MRWTGKRAPHKYTEEEADDSMEQRGWGQEERASPSPGTGWREREATRQVKVGDIICSHQIIDLIIQKTG